MGHFSHNSRALEAWDGDLRIGSYNFLKPDRLRCNQPFLTLWLPILHQQAAPFPESISKTIQNRSKEQVDVGESHPCRLAQ